MKDADKFTLTRIELSIGKTVLYGNATSVVVFQKQHHGKSLRHIKVSKGTGSATVQLQGQNVMSAKPIYQGKIDIITIACRDCYSIIMNISNISINTKRRSKKFLRITRI